MLTSLFSFSLKNVFLCILSFEACAFANYSKFSIFFSLWSTASDISDFRMFWISQTFEIKSVTECFIESRRQVHIDRLNPLMHNVPKWFDIL